MKLSSIAAIVIATVGLSGCIINVNGATPPTHTSHETLQLNAADLSILNAEVGAGALTIKGVRGQTNVRVEADINTYRDIEPTLTLEKDGHHAKLVAEFDSSINFNRSPYIDIVVTVPAAMAMDIHDGSGSIIINGVQADIAITDGSGSINIDGGEKLDIKDGSGSISIDNVMQNIKIADGSGSIDINGGKMIDIDDGSGSIDVTNANGRVDINDGSGSINLENIKGNSTINDGSGSIYIRHVDGEVVIDDGSGGINVEYTKGLKIIDAGSGSLHFKHIDGPVSVDD
ncbi:hypothetical protein D5R81_17370 [Parashewanella spongiae]|uniref:Adhesin domain-containing protein n=1 Tax=Parashewanella spongiae TaxID=342950 RepID=A0A3A6TII2_9GAMM|nr:hypothetical protein [Parashewanella spongiae]MCL1079853.1 DUF4097 domain-containing protein [Parashewanella spongiae]RJY06762.1 hypothetical protein D5R81_17370 [Parashewanella spongiae]